MEFETVEEANDILSNGILVETSKGLVCMSLNDALSSNLNLSVEDLQNVATQLLLQQNKTEIQKICSTVTCDVIGDSDGFTSESSDVSGIINNSETLLAVQIPENSITLTNYVNTNNTKSKCVSDPKLAVLSTDPENLSSTVSDSDTNSIILKPEVHKRSPITKKDNDTSTETTQDGTHKVPAKKRGGWPKGRKRKPELLHLPPKAPATGYNLFLNDQRMLLKDSNLPFHEKTKLIGNKWSSLSLDEKRPYLEKAEEEKRRYREEFKQYRQSGAYQLYLANKRRKRAKYNVLSESDMDATDDIDDEDNEELYCRTCDQCFHNLHNKREHLLSRQHQQSIAGAISKELNSDYETDVAGVTSSLSFSTSLDESSLDAMPSGSSGAKAPNQNHTSQTVVESMNNLFSAVMVRETEIKSLQLRLQETSEQHTALYKQLCSLKETESKLKKQFALLKEQEKDMELKVFHLWQVPSWFIITDLNETTEEYNID
ncbi:HMG (high mobility group) box [Popillia japonica]|uniref:HMG (High mobility group) box n=1 Tax=Popillia japonica TaxID=7064 RepID=A0AAW1KPJ8_POPJA